MIDTARKQFPSNPNNWLYNDWDENTRVFTKVAYLGINDRGWSECTLAEREKYESLNIKQEGYNTMTDE